MAIIEKPSGSSEVFATPEEALASGRSVMSIPIAGFRDALHLPEVQAVHKRARALVDADIGPIRPEQA